MAGMCLNTVARRVILDPEASVIETLRTIQAEQLEISKHDHIALSELAAEGVPVSSMFNSLLNFLSLPPEEDADVEIQKIFSDARIHSADGYVFVS